LRQKNNKSKKKEKNNIGDSIHNPGKKLEFTFSLAYKKITKVTPELKTISENRLKFSIYNKDKSFHELLSNEVLSMFLLSKCTFSELDFYRKPRNVSFYRIFIYV
jgi:hypothetical protein